MHVSRPHRPLSQSSPPPLPLLPSMSAIRNNPQYVGHLRKRRLSVPIHPITD